MLMVYAANQNNHILVYWWPSLQRIGHCEPEVSFACYPPAGSLPYDQGNDLMQLASHLNYFNLGNQDAIQPHHMGQAAYPSSHGASLQHLSAEQRMSMDYPSMAPGAMSLDASSLGSIRTQLAASLGFPTSNASERSGSITSMTSDRQPSLGSPGFAPGSQPLPIQRPRRHANGQVYWM